MTKAMRRTRHVSHYPYYGYGYGYPYNYGYRGRPYDYGYRRPGFSVRDAGDISMKEMFKTINWPTLIAGLLISAVVLR